MIETTGFIAMLDERRPARATGEWAEVWSRVLDNVPEEHRPMVSYALELAAADTAERLDSPGMTP